LATRTLGYTPAMAPRWGVSGTVLGAVLLLASGISCLRHGPVAERPARSPARWWVVTKDGGWLFPAGSGISISEDEFAFVATRPEVSHVQMTRRPTTSDIMKVSLAAPFASQARIQIVGEKGRVTEAYVPPLYVPGLLDATLDRPGAPDMEIVVDEDERYQLRPANAAEAATFEAALVRTPTRHELCRRVVACCAVPGIQQETQVCEPRTLALYASERSRHACEHALDYVAEACAYVNEPIAAACAPSADAPPEGWWTPPPKWRNTRATAFKFTRDEYIIAYGHDGIDRERSELQSVGGGVWVSGWDDHAQQLRLDPKGRLVMLDCSKLWSGIACEPFATLERIDAASARAHDADLARAPDRKVVCDKVEKCCDSDERPEPCRGLSARGHMAFEAGVSLRECQAFQDDLLDWFKQQGKSPPAECQ
jgi:hypothetical protein